MLALLIRIMIFKYYAAIFAELIKTNIKNYLYLKKIKNTGGLKTRKKKKKDYSYEVLTFFS